MNSSTVEQTPSAASRVGGRWEIVTARRWNSQLSNVVRLLGAGLLPGVPFAIARIILHTQSGLANLDYLLLTLIACAWSRPIASVFFVLTYLLEAIRLLDAVYFLSQQDIAYSAHFLHDVPSLLIFLWLSAFVLLTIAGLCVWLRVVPRCGGRLAWSVTGPALLLGVLLGAVDMAQGFDPTGARPRRVPREHMVGELLFRMPFFMAHAAAGPATASPLSHSATDSLWENGPARRLQENIVIIVVESMGLLLDDAGRDREFAVLEDPALKQRYEVMQGEVPFHGATIAGEMRELCHLQTGVRITRELLGAQYPCLPAQFLALGYQTSAYHGYRSMLFQRKQWYADVGFAEESFLGDMKGTRNCNGMFYGVCDASVATVLMKRLEAKTASHAPPQFLYWMTLNSHLPIDKDRAPVRVCPILGDHETCSQLAYIQVVLEAVKKLALDPAIGSTEFVVVGDHAPPYVSPARRMLFSDDEVPMVTLLPKN